jgi:PilZ domain
MGKSSSGDAKAPNSGGASGGGSAAGSAAAGSARASEARARAEDAAGGNKRRSDRVLVALPIELTATDLSGVRFTEACLTEMVSLHGASVALARRASAEHPVTLRRRSLDLEVEARILGQLGIRPGQHIYGIAFTEDSPNFWGIHFPRLEENDESCMRTLLKCAECGKRLIFSLNEIEFRVFEANQRLTFGCETCGHNVAWIPVPNQDHVATNRARSAEIENRKHTRTRMKAMACIQEAGRADDIVVVVDISRGGVSFRGHRAYEVQSWIQFAVPYTPGAANIFVSGRIAWRKQLAEEQYEHGVQYVRT